jgi:hypothetical protein
MKPTPPLHTAALGRSTLRFFRSPLQGADFPYHAHDDLLVCLGLPRELRRFFKKKLVNDWKDNIKTIATVNSIVTIAPHYVAQGLIGAAIETGHVSTRFADHYAVAAAEALKAITVGWSPDETVAFLCEAFKRQSGGGVA